MNAEEWALCGAAAMQGVESLKRDEAQANEEMAERTEALGNARKSLIQVK